MGAEEDTKEEQPGAISGGDEEQPNPIEAALEGAFEQLGRLVARMPLVFIGVSLLITIVFSAGRGMLKEESRPEKQWVPDGALALEHGDYVNGQWPSEQRFNLYIATCANDDKD